MSGAGRQRDPQWVNPRVNPRFARAIRRRGLKMVRGHVWPPALIYHVVESVEVGRIPWLTPRKVAAVLDFARSIGFPTSEVFVAPAVIVFGPCADDAEWVAGLDDQLLNPPLADLIGAADAAYLARWQPFDQRRVELLGRRDTFLRDTPRNGEALDQLAALLGYVGDRYHERTCPCGQEFLNWTAVPPEYVPDDLLCQFLGIEQ